MSFSLFHFARVLALECFYCAQVMLFTCGAPPRPFDRFIPLVSEVYRSPSVVQMDIDTFGGGGGGVLLPITLTLVTLAVAASAGSLTTCT